MLYRKQLGPVPSGAPDAVVYDGERGALPMIDRQDIRQATDRCRQYLGLNAGRWLWSFEHKADSLIAKFKEAANGQRDRCMSRVTAIIPALVICIIVWLVMGC